jgi:RHS repeat-associated protein
MGNVTSVLRMDSSAGLAQLRPEFLYDYDAFGKEIRSTALIAGSNPDSYPFHFSTKYTDGETGLVYYGYRFYDPVNGRWLGRDPIGEVGGENLYGMMGNDVVNGFDVLGNQIFLGPTVTPYMLPRFNFNPGSMDGPPLGPTGTPFSPFTPFAPLGPDGTGSTSIPHYEPSTEQPFPNVPPPPQVPTPGPKTHSAKTAEQRAQRTKERQDYKDACDTPTQKEKDAAASGDECAKLRERMARKKRCAEMRQAWDDKWSPGQHEEPINSAKRGFNRDLEKLRELEKNGKCKPNCHRWIPGGIV